jgi:hypothetical protein
MRIRLTALPAVVSLLMLPFCADEVVPPPPPTFPAASALEISVEQRAFPIEVLRSYHANLSKYEFHSEDVGALFVLEQVHSEYWDATEGSPSGGDLDRRIDTLYEDAGYAAALARYDPIYFVVDFQRRDREWLVDWEGRLRDEEINRGTFTFGVRRDENDDDYFFDVLDRIQNITEDHVPEAIILGMEMNRYYDQAPGDWDNYVEFYWMLYDAIKETNAGVRVSAGFNWSYFVEVQVPSFVNEGEAVTDVAPFRRAYNAIIDPLMTRDGGSNSDFVALALIPDPANHGNSPSNIPDNYLGGLRLLFGEDDTPIVWFQLGWPVSSSGSSIPGDFYTRFLAIAGGLNVERVAWYGLTHLIDADCQALTGDQVGASQTVCFRGMFSVSGANTALSDKFLVREQDGSTQ